MMRTIQLAVACVAVLVATAEQVQAGVITEITLGDFVAPVVADFEAAPLGNITGTNSVFSDVGISNVLFSGSEFTSDLFNSRPNSSKALSVNSSGLTVVQPGDILASTFSLDFALAGLTQRFGFGRHDQGTVVGTSTVEFFNSGTSVGTFNIPAAASDDLVLLYLHNTDSFNSVRLTQLGTFGFGGWAVDDITLESNLTAVPEPASLAIFAIGACVAGLGAARRRREKQQEATA